ncbi:MAG: imidazolonepropionase [Deltaproteobacteria bacterium]|nr:imidazolonepropionase [Deltaproteobacteria bacterium]
MLITNIGRLVTMEPAVQREGTLGVIVHGAVVMDGDRIAWIGPEKALPADAVHGAATAIDAEGGVVMPGLVDPHTHLVFAGSREGEFVARARGESYHTIAAAGGGILSTVAATRAATEEALLATAESRAWEALRSGTTTIEIKSGYGLTVDDERKILRVVRRLDQTHPIHTVGTFLGAHTVPIEFRDRRGRYVALICDEMIPQVAREGLAQFCDIFVEEGAFTPEEARRILAVGRAHGLRPRLHVDQFHDVGGGALAAEVGALSADHLDLVTREGMTAMARAGVVAGLLPAASFFTGRGHYPPAKALVDAGVPIALATDCNPGTSPTLDLFLCGTIAVTQMGLDPDLALLGMTRVAAQSLGRAERIGTLGVGKQADLLLLRCQSEYFPLYRFGSSAVRVVICDGEVVWGE